jgi:hypothetical protein
MEILRDKRLSKIMKNNYELKKHIQEIEQDKNESKKLLNTCRKYWY